MATHRAGGTRGRVGRGRARTHLGALVTLVTIGAVAIGIGLQSSAEPPAPGVEEVGDRPAPGSEGFGDRRATAAADGEAGVLPSRPVRLDIPAVDIHTRVIELGLNPDRTLEVPSQPLLAGWYTGSPTPGQRGSSVVAGHVDSEETGPAVFYRLGELTPGSRIDVTLENGDVTSFEVAEVRLFPQADFPTRVVYGHTRRPTLRLITCGDWNEDTQEYDGNVVVFAALVRPAR